MNKKFKSELKSKSMSMQAVMQIGKNSLSDDQIISIRQYLKKHELMKIKLLSTAIQNKQEIQEQILQTTNSLLINSIGGVIVVYKKKED